MENISSNNYDLEYNHNKEVLLNKLSDDAVYSKPLSSINQKMCHIDIKEDNSIIEKNNSDNENNNFIQSNSYINDAINEYNIDNPNKLNINNKNKNIANYATNSNEELYNLKEDIINNLNKYKTESISLKRSSAKNLTNKILISNSNNNINIDNLSKSNSLNNINADNNNVNITNISKDKLEDNDNPQCNKENLKEDSILYNKNKECNEEDNEYINNNLEILEPQDQPLYIMNLELEGRSAELKIYENSSADELSYSFCRDNGLDYDSMKYLKAQISSLLDQYKFKNSDNDNQCINDSNKNSNINSKRSKFEVIIEEDIEDGGNRSMSKDNITISDNNESNKEVTKINENDSSHLIDNSNFNNNNIIDPLNTSKRVSTENISNNNKEVITDSNKCSNKNLINTDINISNNNKNIENNDSGVNITTGVLINNTDTDNKNINLPLSFNKDILYNKIDNQSLDDENNCKFNIDNEDVNRNIDYEIKNKEKLNYDTDIKTSNIFKNKSDKISKKSNKYKSCKHDDLKSLNNSKNTSKQALFIYEFTNNDSIKQELNNNIKSTNIATKVKNNHKRKTKEKEKCLISNNNNNNSFKNNNENKNVNNNRDYLNNNSIQIINNNYNINIQNFENNFPIKLSNTNYCNNNLYNKGLLFKEEKDIKLNKIRCQSAINAQNKCTFNPITNKDKYKHVQPNHLHVLSIKDILEKKADIISNLKSKIVNDDYEYTFKPNLNNYDINNHNIKRNSINKINYYKSIQPLVYNTNFENTRKLNTINKVESDKLNNEYYNPKIINNNDYILSKSNRYGLNNTDKLILSKSNESNMQYNNNSNTLSKNDIKSIDINEDIKDLNLNINCEYNNNDNNKRLSNLYNENNNNNNTIYVSKDFTYRQQQYKKIHQLKLKTIKENVKNEESKLLSFLPNNEKFQNNISCIKKEFTDLMSKTFHNKHISQLNYLPNNSLTTINDKTIVKDINDKDKSNNFNIPKTSDLDVYTRSYLYSKVYDYNKSNKEELQTNVFLYNSKASKINLNSIKIFENKKNMLFLKLFYILDTDNDNIINRTSVATHRLNTKLNKLINPLIKELKEENETLNSQEFVHAMNYLYTSMEYKTKETLINLLVEIDKSKCSYLKIFYEDSNKSCKKMVKQDYLNYKSKELKSKVNYKCYKNNKLNSSLIYNELRLINNHYSIEDDKLNKHNINNNNNNNNDSVNNNCYNITNNNLIKDNMFNSDYKITNASNDDKVETDGKLTNNTNNANNKSKNLSQLLMNSNYNNFKIPCSLDNSSVIQLNKNINNVNNSFNNLISNYHNFNKYSCKNKYNIINNSASAFSYVDNIEKNLELKNQYVNMENKLKSNNSINNSNLSSSLGNSCKYNNNLNNTALISDRLNVNKLKESSIRSSIFTFKPNINENSRRIDSRKNIMYSE